MPFADRHPPAFHHHARSLLRATFVAAALAVVAPSADSGASPARAANSSRSDEKDRLAVLDGVKVSAAEALKLASAEVPGGVPLRLALMRRDGALSHEIRFIVGDGEGVVAIDAISGEVRRGVPSELSADRRRELASMTPLLLAAEISPLEAAEVVIARIPGARLLVVEAEVERGVLQYEVTVRGPDGLAKAEVDAESGAIRTLVGARPKPVDDPRHSHFDVTAANSTPEHWLSDAPGVDAPPAWVARPDPAAPSPPHVLGLAKPAGDPAAALVAWTPRLRFQDGELEVRVRLLRTAEEPSGRGGLVWRLRDALEHYALSLDGHVGDGRVGDGRAGEGRTGELALEVVRDGLRRRLAAVPFTPEPGRWYRLGVRHVGDRIEVSLDGEPRLVANDSTLPAEGAVGVWTRGDGAAVFDDLKGRALPTDGG